MAEQNPIQGMMYTAMQSLKEMIDVNTIVGDAVTAPDGTVIIPISKVAVGFGVGGSEFSPEKSTPVNPEDGKMFGGGSGGGISINPVAFMVVSNGQFKLVPVSEESTVYERLLYNLPDAVDKVADAFSNIKSRRSGKNNDEASDVEMHIDEQE